MFNQYMENAKKYVVEEMHISMDSRDYDKIKIEDIARTMVTIDLLNEQRKTNELLQALLEKGNTDSKPATVAKNTANKTTK
ncbi:MAG: hypothetical protein ACRC1T_09160 [Clostridium chrysemydis]|uniref:hypothetical protein n=1 Tax=Clostridium chrysemydis TaxID=2665504 RepID=UPI003F2E95DC